MNPMILIEIIITRMNPMGSVITGIKNQGIDQRKGTENRTTMKATNNVAVINQGTSIVTGMEKWYLRNVVTQWNGREMCISISNTCL